MTKLFAYLLVLGTLVGCSSQPKQPAEQQKKSTEAPKQEQITGRSAFQKLYISARGWAPDARPYQLQSLVTKESTGKEGKSGVWRGSFASASRGAVKSFIWSGLRADDAPSPGVTPGTEDTYNPNNTSTQVFDMAFLKVDSDKAYEVAQKHGGEKLTKVNPEQPVFYLLNWRASANELVWHVIYGDNFDNAKLKVAVDATSGEFMRVEK